MAEMELMISDEQEALVEAVRQWLGERTDLVAAHADRGEAVLVRSEDVQAAAGLGLTGLLRDSGGGTHTDLALVVEELGHAVSPLPLGQAALACRALDDAGLAADVAEAVAAGSAIAVPAVPDPGEAAVRAAAGPDGSLILNGQVPVVIGALSAGHVLVAADLAGGAPVLALVGTDAEGLGRTARTSLDITRDFASVTFDGVRAPAEAWAEVSPDVLESLAGALALHHAADAVGAAERLLAMTVRYVGERQQFGRVVGGFQAVKHHCANMAVDVESARVTVRAAARALDGADAGERRVRIAEAAAVAGEACSRVAGTALQLHGGMGFTWEHDLHLYLRRIKTGELLGGTPRHHRTRLLDLVA
jgi:alkylation response protein AidB-like acyl-CoA dehydrogenase